MNRDTAVKFTRSCTRLLFFGTILVHAVTHFFTCGNWQKVAEHCACRERWWQNQKYKWLLLGSPFL